MALDTLIELTYFPGCSLATSARESNESLVKACEFMGLGLIDLEDWNCCGSSSAHSLDTEAALGLCARNLARAPKDKPLMTMCPSCYRNLSAAQLHLKEDNQLRRAQERKWGGEIDPELKIITFLELLHFLGKLRQMGARTALEPGLDLGGLKAAPYYGCMTMLPPSLKRIGPPTNPVHKQLESLGAEVLVWAGQTRCCGTFLTAARPDIAGPLVDNIIQGAISAGAECIVTACAMCQLNLEIRCTLKNKIPIFHFSEIVALVLGAKDYEGWFNRHLVDPRPLLESKGLVA